nr:probable purple acid phosphatase 20 [Ipomoea batatas]
MPNGSGRPPVLVIHRGANLSIGLRGNTEGSVANAWTTAQRPRPVPSTEAPSPGPIYPRAFGACSPRPEPKTGCAVDQALTSDSIPTRALYSRAHSLPYCESSSLPILNGAAECVPPGSVMIALVNAVVIAIIHFMFFCQSRPAKESVFVSLSQDYGNSSSSPQQVHISVVGKDRMRISWITEDSGTPTTVEYGTSPGNYRFSVNGGTTNYTYVQYKSGEIHDVVVGPLNPSTVYYYRCGGGAAEYSFKTPPPWFPIKFAVIGDLGQTKWTRTTLERIGKSNYDMLLLPGDLSYAETNQSLWDSYGPPGGAASARRRPWMVTEGNHEYETLPTVHTTPFTAYNARWHMPYEESGSNSNLFYSFDVAGVHVVMLGTYADFWAGNGAAAHVAQIGPGEKLTERRLRG